MSKKPVIKVKLGDGTVREYDSIEEWRADTRKINESRRTAIVSEPPKTWAKVTTPPKTLPPPRSKMSTAGLSSTSEAASLTKAFKKLTKKKK